MQHKEFAPPETLRHAIKCFWYDRRDFGENPAGFEVVPDGYAEIVFHFGGPCRLFYRGSWQPLASPCLMGLLQQPVRLHAQNQLEILGIRCYPWAVFDLLGLPAGKDGAHIVAHPLARLHAPLATALQRGQPEEALALLTQYFLGHQPPPAADPLLGKAGVALREAHGGLSVGEVAAAAHATVRTLERKFNRAAGFTVKDVSSLMRFEQVRNHLWRQPEANLAGLAQELGYADQAHLSREFKRYSGTSPAAFARQAKEQARRGDFVAFVQA